MCSPSVAVVIGFLQFEQLACIERPGHKIRQSGGCFHPPVKRRSCRPSRPGGILSNTFTPAGICKRGTIANVAGSVLGCFCGSRV